MLFLTRTRELLLLLLYDSIANLTTVSANGNPISAAYGNCNYFQEWNNFFVRVICRLGSNLGVRPFWQVRIFIVLSDGNELCPPP